MEKRGQYYTIDAFIALFVIAAGLILALAFHSFGHSSIQPEALSQELLNTFAETRISEVNNGFVLRQTGNGNITNKDNTVLQQAYEFKQYFDSRPGVGYKPEQFSNLSAELLESVTGGTIPPQYSFEVIIDGDVVYTRGSGENESRILVSSKQIAFGALNRTQEFWGPVTAEVRVWE
ncbi:hypothetical protein HYU12_03000 [Candidatus Woesearchaeota archaeon]|nr:hypothetical protein [Candidatus Woesearchaeota archaeon]